MSQPSGAQTPTSVFAKLVVGGVTKDSATFSPWSAASGPRQIVLGYDASGSATGLYPFTLEVRNRYTGADSITTIADTLIVVNRSASPFGAGWWVAGVEQLVLSQPGNKILWVDGDGSAAVYRPLDSTHWRRAAGEFRDTLLRSGSTYTRTLRHGVQVRFDTTAGRHVQTVNRTGQTTSFTWTGSPARLTSIQVPPGGSGTTYALAYDGAGTLDSIRDPANRTLNATVSGGNLTQLVDPDAHGVSFGYDAAHRLTSRTSRRNYATAYTYANGLHVSRVAVPLAGSDSARTTFRWWDEQGLALGSPSGSQAAADTASVYSKVFGPRGVGDDATFWVDRWGAPVRMVGAVSDTGLIARDSASGLITRYRNPAGRVWGLSYDARGNLLTQTDSTHEGTGSVQNATSRYTYHDAHAPDSPDSVIDPTGVVTHFRYNVWGLDSLATAPASGVTRFLYRTSGALTGLVDSITDLAARTYSDTLAWGTGTSNTDHTTRFSYNSLGNVDSTRSPMGSVRAYRYNSLAQVQYAINALGDTTRYFPTVMGAVDSTSQYGPSGERRTVRMTYDNDFNRLTVSDPRAVTRTWAYDAAGRDTAETDDFNRTERRWYGPSGLLDSTLTRDSIKVRRTYDAGARLTQIRFPPRDTGSLALSDTLTFRYDAAGRLDTAVNRSATFARQYYREGTLKQEQQRSTFDAAHGGVNFDVTNRYQYDLADRRSAFRNVPTGGGDTLHLEYTYASGFLHDLVIDYPGTSVANDTATYTWDSFGRRQALLTPHHATVSWYFDLDDRLRRVYSTHDCHGACVVDSAQVDKQYQRYDRADRPIKIVQYVGLSTASFVDTVGYDRYGQVTFDGPPNYRHFYVYDSSGNRLSDLTYTNGIPYGTKWVYSHNRLAADSALDQDGSHLLFREYAYSPSGDLMEKQPASLPQLRRWMWYDAVGHMTSTKQYLYYVEGPIGPHGHLNYYATPDVETDACRYDALGRRVRACGASSMAYDGDNPVWVQRARIIYGPGQDEPLVVFDTTYGAQRLIRYFITDGAGRLLSYTDSNGVNAFADSLFNQVAVQSGAIAGAETFGATSGETINVPQLAYFRNRYYDTQTGRFAQEDPSGVAGGTNLYAYVGNNPATFTDPFGLNPCLIVPQVCIYAAVVVSGAIAGGLGQAITNIQQGQPIGHGVLLAAAREARNASAAGLLGEIGANLIGAAGRFLGTVGGEEVETQFGTKIIKDMTRRGWTRSDVEGTIADPLSTRAVRDHRHIPGGTSVDEPATAYYSKNGGYVVRNDRTGDVVQVSNRHNPNWREPE